MKKRQRKAEVEEESWWANPPLFGFIKGPMTLGFHVGGDALQWGSTPWQVWPHDRRIELAEKTSGGLCC